VQLRYRESLAKALGVKWEQLTCPPNDAAMGANEVVLDKIQMNFRVEPKVRTALSLVCRRYDIQPSEVIALAPLLMLLTAEKSLEWRSDNLNATWNGLDEMENNAPNLAKYFSLSTSAQDALHAEAESIEQKDVFGRHVETEIAQPVNPFMEYLNNLASNSDKALPVSLESDAPERIDYTILVDDMKSTGVLASEEDEDLLRYFMIGAINFDEALSNYRALNKEDYSKWLGIEKQRVEEESRASLIEMFG